MNSEDPFKWNGSSLGNISDSQILVKYILAGIEYWRIKIGYYETICIVRKQKDYSPCIVDELKPIFGLVKLGTHYAHHNESAYYIILIRSRMSQDGKNIQPEVSLKGYEGELDDSVREKIKHIYVFRDILCLSKTKKSVDDGSIILRKNITDDQIFPVSFIDGSIKVAKMIDISISTYIPETIFKKWLANDSPSKLLSGMCRIKGRDSILNGVFKIKSKINDILEVTSRSERIDLSDIIIKRVTDKLEFHAAKN